MITEKDILEHINSASPENPLKELTRKYLEKLKEFEKIQWSQQEEYKSLQQRSKELEDSMNQTRGAIFALLDLVAEEEGLLSVDSNKVIEEPKNSNNTTE